MSEQTSHVLDVKGKRFVEEDDIETKLKVVVDGFELLKTSSNNISKEATKAAADLYEQLRETKYRFFHVIDSIDEIIIVKDSHNKWKTANLFTQKLLKLEPKDYIGNSNNDVGKKIPKFSGLLSKFEITDNDAWVNQAPIRVVEEIKVDDEVYYFDFIKTPVYDDDGNKKELITIGRDITNIKKRELIVNTYTSALESVKDILLIVNKSKKIMFYNNSEFMSLFDLPTKDNYSLNDIIYTFNEKEFDSMWANITNNYVYNENITISIDKRKIKINMTAVPLVIRSVPEYFIITFKKLVT